MLRVLFIYDEGSSQAEPVLRAKPHLAREGVDLLCDSVSPVAHDLILLQQTRVSTLPTWLDTDHTPVVFLERIDGAQLTSTVRLALRKTNVVGVIKNTLFRDQSLYQTCGWRHQEDLLRDCRGKPRAPPHGVAVGEAALAKLHLGFSFCAYERMLPFMSQEINWQAERPYDVHFAGTVEYGEPGDGDRLIAWHRRRCVEAIQALDRTTLCETGRPLSFERYRETMLQSKVVISPWGWGEACYRDYEALLSGCVLVKPHSMHVASPEGIYQRCVHCSPDFENLPEAVEVAMRHYNDVAGRQRLRTDVAQLNTMAIVAESLAGTLRLCWGRWTNAERTRAIGTPG